MGQVTDKPTGVAIVWAKEDERSDEWLKQHYATIGASNAAASIGKGRFKSARDLYTQMRGVLADDVLPPRVSGDDIRRGSMLEPLARELLAEHHQVAIEAHDQNDFLTNGKFPWAHALPDASIGPRPVELKVPRPITVAKCNTDGLLDDWWIQCQHTLAIVDADLIYVGLLDPISCRIHPFQVERDSVFIEQIMDAEEAFFERVKSGNPPDAPDPADAGENGTGMVTLDSDEARTAAATFLRVKQLVKDGEETVDALKAKLRDLSGNAEAFEVPGVLRAYDRFGKAPRRFNRKAAFQVHPDLEDDMFWSIGKPARTFRAYDLQRGI